MMIFILFIIYYLYLKSLSISILLTNSINNLDNHLYLIYINQKAYFSFNNYQYEN